MIRDKDWSQRSKVKLQLQLHGATLMSALLMRSSCTKHGCLSHVHACCAAAAAAAAPDRSSGGSKVVPSDWPPATSHRRMVGRVRHKAASTSKSLHTPPCLCFPSSLSLALTLNLSLSFHDCADTSGVFLLTIATVPFDRVLRLYSISSYCCHPPNMSSSSNAIAIPRRKGKHPAASRHSIDSSSSSSASTPSTPSYASHSRNYQFTPTENRFSYGSYGSSASSSPSNSPQSASSMRRRESLMSATFSKAEHTVINVGEEECPRLVWARILRLQSCRVSSRTTANTPQITCVKASQGFDWNQGKSLSQYCRNGCVEAISCGCIANCLCLRIQKSSFRPTPITTLMTSSVARILSRTLYSRTRRSRTCFRHKHALSSQLHGNSQGCDNDTY